ncbi:hypothetical protein TNCV_1329761 [Trichonephila clavipes]|nr:hypothetical protein TNCV_1329761 [Trichonephila clavipes]
MDEKTLKSDESCSNPLSINTIIRFVTSATVYLNRHYPGAEVSMNLNSSLTLGSHNPTSTCLPVCSAHHPGWEERRTTWSLLTQHSLALRHHWKASVRRPIYQRPRGASDDI